MTIALYIGAPLGVLAVIAEIYFVRIATSPPVASFGAIIAGVGFALLLVVGIIALVRLL